MELSEYTYDPDYGMFWNKWGNPVGSYTRKYGRIVINGKEFKLSRLAFFLVNGRWPEGEMDHINGNTKDDRWENLRECVREQNARNKGKRKTNKLGFKGVYPQYYKDRTYYNASIQVQKVRIYLGRFESAEEAAKAYNEAALKHHGEFAKLNIIP